MSLFCENCGAKLADDAVFCEVCGAKVTPSSDAPAGSQDGAWGETPSAPGWAGAEPQQYERPQQYEHPQQYERPQYEQREIPRPVQDAPGREERPDFGGSGYGNGPAPGGGKGGGGIPKAALIGGAAVVLIAVLGGVFFLKGKKGNDETESTAVVAESTENSGNTESTGSVSTAQPASESTSQPSTGSTGTASGSTGGKSAAEQAAALDAAMNIAGGISDPSMLKIPDGAEIKTDAEFVDLIGEYEGEIQMTTFSGFEKVDGVPSNIMELQQQVLSGPLPCTLEIEEDGQWEIKWEFMGSMSFDSNDYDNPEEVTPEQIQLMMVNRPTNGIYHTSFDMSGEVDDGNQGRMAMEHTGAYCTSGDDRLIAGNHMMAIQMYGADVNIQGDFVVHKTTEDFAKEERDAINSANSSQTEVKPSEEDDSSNGNYGSSSSNGNYGSSSGSTGAQDNGSANTSGGNSDTVSTDLMGRKAQALAGRQNGSSGSNQGGNSGSASPAQEISTVSGGEWIQIASVWFYQKDGAIVKNSWIDDNGVYYYVDETGYMLSNAYTPDGYFVGPDGSYDPNAPQNQADGGNYIEDTPAGEAMAAIASKLSTNENAGATEFDWFLDYVNHTGYGLAQVITDPTQATRINDLQPALNGGWKCFICTEKGAYGSDVERYLNANIEASGGKFNITLNFKYLVDPNGGGTIEESDHWTYRGTYDDQAGTATAATSDSRIDFDGFYLSADGQTEYATGTFRWISGEVDRIALMRSAH